MALAKGIDDVVGWYESLPDDVWSQWEAFDRVEPIGCEWERHASVMAMLETVYAATINPHLEQSDRIKPRPPQEFLPSGFTGEKPKRRRATLREQLALVAKVFGGRSGNNNQ